MLRDWHTATGSTVSATSTARLAEPELAGPRGEWQRRRRSYERGKFQKETVGPALAVIESTTWPENIAPDPCNSWLFTNLNKPSDCYSVPHSWLTDWRRMYKQLILELSYKIIMWRRQPSVKCSTSRSDTVKCTYKLLLPRSLSKKCICFKKQFHTFCNKICRSSLDFIPQKFSFSKIGFRPGLAGSLSVQGFPLVGFVTT